METKTVVVLEVVKNDHTFRMELPLGSSLGDAYEAAWSMLKKIADLANESVDKVKQETSED